MAKDKRKKKYFQGMGQFRPEMATNQINESVEDQTLPESRFVRKDLIKTIAIVIVMLALFAGLTILDRKTSILTQVAEKVTNIFIK